ncbi:hypothetical protein SAMN05421780_104175 [Flexibacter flexilis DSM 6793]|uniref:Uncharacterized protein n=1 Tax=Flexibacter flexilis DSM 6793 TaxID=927664 RepID=A0A1I1I1P5_9BACT|nr:hypothetical protein SAMN05421780_104175 [Flexibacter flexilis DSM 6793]
MEKHCRRDIFETINPTFSNTFLCGYTRFGAKDMFLLLIFSQPNKNQNNPLYCN